MQATLVVKAVQQ